MASTKLKKRGRDKRKKEKKGANNEKPLQ